MRIQVIAELRRYSRWRNVLPLHDGRECPRCRAIVCGRDSWPAHRDWHDRMDADAELVRTAIRKLCAKTGLTVGERPLDEVDLDERLTRKAVRALAGDGFSEYDEDDEDQGDDE